MICYNLFMKKLLLTSKGLTIEISKSLSSLLIKKPHDNQVAFITTASYGEYTNNFLLKKTKSFLVNLYSKINLKLFGFNNIFEIDLRKENSNSLNEKLKNKDIIFINGGNTFYLLYWMRKSRLDKLLPKLLNEGVIYIGLSASSYICCPTIEQAHWKPQDKNNIKLKNLKGLNYLPFIITAHFKEEYKSAVEKNAKNIEWPVVALNDKQAILVKNNKYKIVGEGEKVFYNGFKENWI